MTYLLFQSVIASCVFVHISVLINVKQHMWCYDANKKKMGSCHVSCLCIHVHGSRCYEREGSARLMLLFSWVPHNVVL